jgi:cytidine deaminase
MKHKITLHYRTYENWRNTSVFSKEITERLESLLKTAHAPYSKYPVSSIVVMESGTMIVGTNQENAAFPSGLCAERVAVLAAKAAHPDEAIQTVYIMTGESEREPAAPCGSCRQVLHETELRQTKPFELILLNKTNNALAFTGVKGLLPFSFTLPR